MGLTDYDSPAGRLVEVFVGLIVLAMALFLGYFGVKGAIAYAGGSRAAPADPVACAIGLTVGVAGSFLAFRLIAGWHEERALLPHVVLLLCGVGAIAGGIWMAMIERDLGGSLVTGIQQYSYFLVVGVAAIGLWWHRRRQWR